MTGKTWSRAGRIAFVAAVIALALWRYIDVAQIGRLLGRASLPLLLVALLAACLDLVIMGLKWNLLLRAFGVEVSAAVAISAYYRGQVFSLFIPSIIGTDAYRAYWLRRHGAPLLPVASSIFVERFLGMLSSVAIICLLLPFALQGFAVEHPWLWAVPGWLGLLPVALVVLGALRGSEWLGRHDLLRRLPGKVERLTRGFLRSVGEIRRHRSAVFTYFLISCGEKLIYGTCVWLGARAIGLFTDYRYVVAAIPLIALLERLPISVRAIGIREGLFVALLHPYGVDATTAVTVALILRGLELIRLAIGAFFWLAGGGRDASAQELARVERDMGAKGTDGDHEQPVTVAEIPDSESEP